MFYTQDTYLISLSFLKNGDSLSTLPPYLNQRLFKFKNNFR